MIFRLRTLCAAAALGLAFIGAAQSVQNQPPQRRTSGFRTEVVSQSNRLWIRHHRPKVSGFRILSNPCDAWQGSGRCVSPSDDGGSEVESSFFVSGGTAQQCIEAARAACVSGNDGDEIKTEPIPIPSMPGAGYCIPQTTFPSSCGAPPAACTSTGCEAAAATTCSDQTVYDNCQNLCPGLLGTKECVTPVPSHCNSTCAAADTIACGQSIPDNSCGDACPGAGTLDCHAPTPPAQPPTTCPAGLIGTRDCSTPTPAPTGSGPNTSNTAQVHNAVFSNTLGNTNPGFVSPGNPSSVPSGNNLANDNAQAAIDSGFLDAYQGQCGTNVNCWQSAIDRHTQAAYTSPTADVYLGTGFSGYPSGSQMAQVVADQRTAQVTGFLPPGLATVAVDSVFVVVAPEIGIPVAIIGLGAESAGVLAGTTLGQQASTNFAQNTQSPSLPFADQIATVVSNLFNGGSNNQQNANSGSGLPLGSTVADAAVNAASTASNYLIDQGGLSKGLDAVQKNSATVSPDATAWVASNISSVSPTAGAVVNGALNGLALLSGNVDAVVTSMSSGKSAVDVAQMRQAVQADAANNPGQEQKDALNQLFGN